MKINQINILTLVLASLFLLGSCKEESKPIGDPLSQVTGIVDTWKLNNINQVDELNDKSDNFLDVSSIMMGTDAAEITFNADKTFTLVVGTMRNFLPVDGSWAFDNDEYPSQIILTDSNGDTVLDMLSPVRENVDNSLAIKYIRPINGCADLEGKRGAVSYEYHFERL